MEDEFLAIDYKDCTFCVGDNNKILVDAGAENCFNCGRRLDGDGIRGFGM